MKTIEIMRKKQFNYFFLFSVFYASAFKKELIKSWLLFLELIFDFIYSFVNIYIYIYILILLEVRDGKI